MRGHPERPRQTSAATPASKVRNDQMHARQGLRDRGPGQVGSGDPVHSDDHQGG
jgi:hypothetical protein